MKKATPLGERIIATAEPITEKKKGSIIIPETIVDSEPLNFFNVISVGSKCEVVKAGDRILCSKSSAAKLNSITDNEELFIILESSVILID